MVAPRIIQPQPGFQWKALSTQADIAILGGSAGGGKTFIELLEFLRYKHVPEFNAVIFRRSTPQIRNAGGLWDASTKIFPYAGGKGAETALKWTFPSGATCKFSHIEYEKNLLDWMGSEIPYIGFDELTHFSKEMFFYMLSRNRSTCGVQPFIRATCNPDPDSWVAELIEWWIDQDTGYPIPEREGVLRYFTREGDNYVWGSTKEEVLAQCPGLFDRPEVIENGIDPLSLIKSITFIPGRLKENKILLDTNPEYLANLLMQSPEEKAKLLDGNWKIRIDGLGLFEWLPTNDVFSNYIQHLLNVKHYITVDAARFGRDLCVIMVWKGWQVIHTTVFKKSDVHTIVKHVTKLRKKFGVMESNVIIDADGVGSDSVHLGHYRAFHGGSPAKKDPNNTNPAQKNVPENYKNFKTQCFYRIANRVNLGLISVIMNGSTCIVFEDSELPGKFTELIILKGTKVEKITDVFKKHLRAIKRWKADEEGKLRINPKDGEPGSQKDILAGASPDFADCFMMREAFELLPDPVEMRRLN